MKYLRVLTLAVFATACGSSGGTNGGTGGGGGAVAAPDIPQCLKAVAETSDQAYLEWDAALYCSAAIAGCATIAVPPECVAGTTPYGGQAWFPTNVTAIKIYRDGTYLTSVPYKGSSTYNNGGLMPHTQYCYTISAVGPGGESAQSDPMCATSFAVTSDSCAPATACNTCVASKGCGWCNSSNVCQSGNGSGPSPTVGACPGFWSSNMLDGNGFIHACPGLTNPACQACISACQGVSGCCTGCGCICQEECTGAC